MTHFNLRFFKAKYGEKLKVRQNMLIYRQLLKWNEFMKKNYSTAPNDIQQQSPRVKSGTSLKSQQRNHNETSTKKNNEEACDLNRTTPTVNGERWNEEHQRKYMGQTVKWVHQRNVNNCQRWFMVSQRNHNNSQQRNMDSQRNHKTSQRENVGHQGKYTSANGEACDLNETVI